MAGVHKRPPRLRLPITGSPGSEHPGVPADTWAWRWHRLRRVFQTPLARGFTVIATANHVVAHAGLAVTKLTLTHAGKELPRKHSALTLTANASLTVGQGPPVVTSRRPKLAP